MQTQIPSIKFYGLNIDNPMSTQLTQDDFQDTPLGKLKAMSNGTINIKPISHSYRTAKYVWRIANLTVSQEDSKMTRFRAFDISGRQLQEASFGVWYGSCPNEIKGYFEYPPEHGTQYYVPQHNEFVTTQSSGYEVQVLDMLHPSEVLEFGLMVSGNKHDVLIVDFRLFKMSESYPHDS